MLFSHIFQVGSQQSPRVVRSTRMPGCSSAWKDDPRVWWRRERQKERERWREGEGLREERELEQSRVGHVGRLGQSEAPMTNGLGYKDAAHAKEARTLEHTAQCVRRNLISRPKCVGAASQ